MIIHHKNINTITLGLKNKLKYSDDYTFIPLQILHNDIFVGMQGCIDFIESNTDMKILNQYKFPNLGDYYDGIIVCQ